jgi:hypothetical protein
MRVIHTHDQLPAADINGEPTINATHVKRGDLAGTADLLNETPASPSYLSDCFVHKAIH